MQMATVAASARPLMLKDLLKLDPNGDSSCNGFQCYPRRCVAVIGTGANCSAVLDAEQRRVEWPTSALAKISAAIKLRLWSAASPAPRSLSRSLSKQLRSRRFWRRRGAAVKAVSPPPTEPAVGIISISRSEPSTADTETESSAASGSCSDLLRSTTEESWGCGDGDGVDNQDVPAGDEFTHKQKAMESQDKEEQRSPVAVSDFPFEDDDDEEDGQSAGGRLPGRGRLDIAEQVGMLDLDPRFAENEAQLDHICIDNGPNYAKVLMGRGVPERLVDDFLAECLEHGWDIGEKLVAAVEGWMDGDGVVEMEMEISGGCWRGFGQEEAEVVRVEVSELVLEELLDEMLLLSRLASS